MPYLAGVFPRLVLGDSKWYDVVRWLKVAAQGCCSLRPIFSAWPRAQGKGSTVWLRATLALLLWKARQGRREEVESNDNRRATPRAPSKACLGNVRFCALWLASRTWTRTWRWGCWRIGARSVILKGSGSGGCDGNNLLVYLRSIA